MHRSALALNSLKALIGAALLVPVLASGQSFKVFTGTFGPRDEVRVSKPAFKWEIWPSQGPAKATGVDFRINGRQVAARYDADERAVIYNTTAPLASGTHQIDVAVTFEGAYKFNKSWTATVTTVSTSSLPTASSSQAETFAKVNAIRARIGLPGFEMDSRLNTAALKHSEYLAANNLMGHYQSPGTKLFFGRTHQDRVAAYGWSGGAWEGVTWGSGSVDEGVQQLFDAPYHRLPFLQPGTVSFGSGFAGTRMTMEFGTTRQSGVVVSPANGETNVPRKWRNEETPNPLRMHGQQRETGYPIVLAAFDRDGKKIRVTAAKLTLAGTQVPVFVNTPSNDDKLESAAILFPRSNLKPNASYTATFSGVDSNGKAFEVTSTFVTRS